MAYETHEFKIPEETDDYCECSEFILSKCNSIMQDAMDAGRNKICIDTNLKLGLPMENIHRVAGPFVEAWAYETFAEVIEDKDNKYGLVHVEAGERLNFADVILQFSIERKRSSSVTGHVDVKATSSDIANAGKAPNITSFGRIRTEYVRNPDLIFVILSIKHRVTSTRNDETKMMMGIMEVVDFKSYDLKYLSDRDLSYNPALGTGQIQVRDIHYVTLETRTTWEFCQLLDRKFMASKKGYDAWLMLARQFAWIKDD